MTAIGYRFETPGKVSGNAVAAADTPAAGDTAFNTVSAGGTSTITYDSTQFRGALACKIVPVASQSTFVQWGTAMGSITEGWARAYFYWTANPGALVNILVFRDGSAGKARLALNTTGKLVLVDAGGTNQVTFTNAITLNAWIRLELHAIQSATAGLLEAWLYNTPDSTTHTETGSKSNVNTGSAAFTQCRYGDCDGPATAPGTFWIDDLAYSNEQKIGPSVWTLAVPIMAATAAQLAPSDVVGDTIAVPVMAATGGILDPTAALSQSPTVPIFGANGSILVPAITVDQSPTIPILGATADIPDPSVSVSQAPSAPSMNATATLLTPSTALGQTPTAVPMGATASMPAPGVTVDQALAAPAPATASAALQAPTVQLDQSPTVPAMAATAALRVPTLAVDQSLQAPRMQAAASMLAPTTFVGVQRAVSAPLGASADLLDPGVALDQAPTVPAMPATASMPAPSVRLDTTRTVPSLAASGSLLAPDIGLAASMVVPTALRAVAGFLAPTVRIVPLGSPLERPRVAASAGRRPSASVTDGSPRVNVSDGRPR